MKHAKRTLFFLLLTVLSPMILAYAFSFFHIRPHHTTQKGELLSPPITISRATFTSPSTLPLKPTWYLMMKISEHCDSTCFDTLYTLRQIHTTLNKDKSRVNRLLLSEKPISDSQFQTQVQRFFPDLIQAVGNASQSLKSNTVYIVDPTNHAILSYPLPLDGKALLKDLRKLLTYSQIG